MQITSSCEVTGHSTNRGGALYTPKHKAPVLQLAAIVWLGLVRGMPRICLIAAMAAGVIETVLADQPHLNPSESTDSRLEDKIVYQGQAAKSVADTTKWMDGDVDLVFEDNDSSARLFNSTHFCSVVDGWRQCTALSKSITPQGQKNTGGRSLQNFVLADAFVTNLRSGSRDLRVNVFPTNPNIAGQVTMSPCSSPTCFQEPGNILDGTQIAVQVAGYGHRLLHHTDTVAASSLCLNYEFYVRWTAAFRPTSLAVSFHTLNNVPSQAEVSVSAQDRICNTGPLGQLTGTLTELKGVSLPLPAIDTCGGSYSACTGAYSTSHTDVIDCTFE